MPGIVGIIGKAPPEERKGTLAAMLKSMLHESIYASGSLHEGGLNIALGWTAHKNSFSDCLPVWNEGRDICLVFSGEDFAAGERVDALKSKGHVFNPGDASGLVHLYEELGPRFLERINGWFSGVLVDLRERKILLFSDRYGVDRIYYHESRQGFYFASEAKALLKILPELRQLDSRSLGEYFSCGAVLQDRSLFKGVSTLPGGSLWTFAPGQRVRKEAWFKKESWEQQPQLSGSEYYEKLKETWSRILPRYFNGREQAALSLTGGVDCRMILAWAPRGSGALPCYTFGGTYRDCADVKISREIASICQQPYQTIPVGAEFLSNFQTLAERTVYISDGAMDVTGAIDLYVQQKARKIAPVRLSGVYGGEILRRLVMFKPSPRHAMFFNPELMHSAEDAARTYADELNGHGLSFTAFKQAPWYMAAKFAVERSQLTLRTPYFDNELVALAYQSPGDLISSNAVSLRLIHDGNPALAGVGTDRGLLFRSVPVITLATHLFQEFTFKAEYAYDYGMPQWLAGLDHAFAPLHLERLFLGRHKFHHFRVFYRNELAGYMKAVLLDSRTRSRSHLNGARLEELVNAHIKGKRNYTTEIHKILSVELIQRQLIETA
jgi:asparagine synthase (glutamine-hydrolysing)